MKKALLLTNCYQFNSFVDEIRAIRLIIKDKVEVLATWDEDIVFPSGKFQNPAILKLKYPIKKIKYNVAYNFNRNAIIRRDNNSCQYCGKKLSHKEITIDHIVPRSHGGLDTFTNCVVSCYSCNGVKGNRTPEQANMKLKSDPIVPKFGLVNGPDDGSWHEEWDAYLGW